MGEAASSVTVFIRKRWRWARYFVGTSRFSSSPEGSVFVPITS